MDKVSATEIPCGRFQAILVFLAQMTRFSTVWGLYIMMFGNYEPPWRCVDDERDDQTNFTDFMEEFTPGANFTLNLSHGTRHQNTSSSQMDKNPNSSAYYDGTCKVYSSCRRIEFEPGSSTLVTEFELICDKAWVTSLIISVQMFALVPGAYFGGQIGERFGRKVSLYTGTAIMCASISVAIFSYSWEMYTALSFFIALGCGGILSTSSVFMMEFLNPWWRGTLTSVPVWNISLVVFTLLIICLRDWRLIHMVSAIVSGLTFLGVFWVPESMRWLDVHGKTQEAEKVMRRIYKTNKLDSPNRSLRNDVTKDTPKATKVEAHKTFLDLFRNQYVRSITIKASIAWATSHIAYTSLGYGIKSLPGDYYVNAIIASVSEVPVILSVGPLANKIGRRRSTVLFATLALTACAVIVAVHYGAEGDTKDLAITISALIAKAFAATVWCILITMSVELFPTVIRNVGYGFLNLVSGLGGIVAPYLIPQESSWFGVCFSIMIAVLATCMAVTMSLPETKDKPLADVITNLDEEVAEMLTVEKDERLEESISP